MVELVGGRSVINRDTPFSFWKLPRLLGVVGAALHIASKVGNVDVILVTYTQSSKNKIEVLLYPNILRKEYETFIQFNCHIILKQSSLISMNSIQVMAMRSGKLQNSGSCIVVDIAQWKGSPV